MSGARDIEAAGMTPASGYYAHESAYVDDGAQIGDGTKIWHYSHVMRGAIIGENCSLGQNVVVGENVKIGNGCKIQNNITFGEGAILEDYVFCGPGVAFTNVRNPRAAFPRNAEGYLTTRVKHGASIGANATIVCGVTIGDWAFVAAGTMVTKDVPPYGLVAGMPGRRVGWACECGAPLKLEDDRALCTECGRRYEKIGKNAIRRLEC